VEQRFNALDQSIKNKLDSLDANVGQESVQYQHNVRALNESTVNKSKSVIDILLDNDNLSNAQISVLNNLKQELEACKREDIRVSAYNVELAKR